MTVRAMAVDTPAAVETNPLSLIAIEKPEPQAGEILVRVHACGVCRTDLHVVEGELAPKHPRIVPGHEVVGVVEQVGAKCKRFKAGDRAGIAWLRETCGVLRTAGAAGKTCAQTRASRDGIIMEAMRSGRWCAKILRTRCPRG